MLFIIDWLIGLFHLCVFVHICCSALLVLALSPVNCVSFFIRWYDANLWKSLYCLLFHPVLPGDRQATNTWMIDRPPRDALCTHPTATSRASCILLSVVWTPTMIAVVLGAFLKKKARYWYIFVYFLVAFAYFVRLWRWWFTCSLLLRVERFPSWIMNRCWFFVAAPWKYSLFVCFFLFSLSLLLRLTLVHPFDCKLLWWCFPLHPLWLFGGYQYRKSPWIPCLKSRRSCVYFLVAVLYCVLFTALTACNPSDPQAKFVLYRSCSGDAAGVCCGLIHCDMILV